MMMEKQTMPCEQRTRQQSLSTQSIRTRLTSSLQLHRAAFPAGEVEQIIQVVHELWSDNTDATHSALVWVITAPKQTIVGHLSLSSITTQDSRMVGWILAPLAVAPSHRGKRISSELVDHAIRRAMSNYQPRIQIYVDPAFYERFGFDRQQAMNVKRPFPLSQPMG